MTGSCRFEMQVISADTFNSHFKVPTTKKKKPKVTKSVLTNDRLTYSLLNEFGRIELTLPIATVSEGNCFEPWQKKAARHKEQHRQIALSMLSCQIPLPCTVTFIRYGPRFLDEHDNLRMAFKFICDQVSTELTGKGKGRGDNDPRITWKYDQVKSKAKGIKILFEF